MKKPNFNNHAGSSNQPQQEERVPLYRRQSDCLKMCLMMVLAVTFLCIVGTIIAVTQKTAISEMSKRNKVGSKTPSPTLVTTPGGLSTNACMRKPPSPGPECVDVVWWTNTARREAKTVLFMCRMVPSHVVGAAICIDGLTDWNVVFYLLGACNCTDVVTVTRNSTSSTVKAIKPT